MQVTNEKLQQLLVESGHIGQADFETAQKEAQEQNISLEDVLINKNLVTDDQLGKLIADDLGYKFANLKREGIDKNIFKMIPSVVAKNQLAIAFARDENGIKIAMNNPADLDFISLMKKKTGEKVIPYFATKRDILLSLDIYQKKLGEQYDELIKKSVTEAEKKIKKDVPIVKLVDTLLEYAYKNKASDVHIEPHKNKIVVRFRIDGVLHNAMDLPIDLLEAIVSRIKILARLRTDEHFSAQDGKISREFNGEEIDIRVSIVPITSGEKVVMRILSEHARQFTLDTLGLSEKTLEKVDNAVKRPWGMILATGPTGCGKTTTLYSVLKILDRPEVNIATIEDPVEYDIDGVNQIQVNTRTNLTFSKGLRSVVRQDPDIIMVGEIRDEETASTAVNSAMTGHLVLSTLHTNNAATAIPRFLDMKVEPFLIASTINVIIAQRLVRKICEKCRASLTLDQKKINEIKQQLGPRASKILDEHISNNQLTIYQSKGCKACQDTGYSGRIGIFEALKMDDSIKKLIMEKTNAAKIEKQAIENGMTTMIEDGIKKVMAGVTTIDEIIRVTQE